MKLHLKPSLALAAAGFALALAGCGEDSSSASSDVLKGIRSDADLAAFFDFKAIRDSSINKDFEKNNPDQVQDLDDLGPIGVKVAEITGLTRDDLVSMAFSVTNFAALAQDDFENGHVLASLIVSKPLTAGQIKEAVEAVAAENGEEITITIDSSDGADYIDIPESGMGSSPDLFLAVQTGSDSALLLIGDKPSVLGAVSGSGSAPDALVNVGKSLLPNANGWVSFVLPETLKAMLSEQVNSGQMPFPGAAALAGLQDIGFALSASSTFDLNLGATFTSEEEATTIKGLFDGILIGMVKQQATQFFGSTPNFVSNLTSAASGSKVALGTSFNSDDVELLGQMAAQTALGVPMP